MKKIIALVLALACVLCLFAGCNEQPAGTTTGSGSTPGSNPSAGSKPSDPTDPSVPSDPWAGYEITTIADALTICGTAGETATEQKYYLRGTITEIQNDMWGNMVISDGSDSILIYGLYSADGSTRYDAMDAKPVVGDEILVYGVLMSYKNNTPQMKNGWLVDYQEGSGVTPDVPTVELPAFDSTLTVTELLSMPLKEGQITEGRYYVTATISSITNPAYGEMLITDGTSTISVFRTENEDGSVVYPDMAEKPYKGDTVTMHVTVQNYYGTIEIQNAHLISFEAGKSDYNEADYPAMSIADARETAIGTKLTVTGVVARITYANGMIPSGVILVDGTSSIYVYDGDLAARVAIGNTITVGASKTYWILDSETANAAKYGYAGCNQLENAHLLSNDEGSTAFDKSWITETTVKEIMDTPASTDITSKIFKVTALVKRVDGSGFTNYYIDDLDGVTGSYAYTQCSGSDFAWLDAFNGKICTVYVMALNAKSTASGCLWRFLPIEVIDEGFDVSCVNIPEHVVEYYGVGQFLSSYTGDPAAALVGSVDSELLGFTGAALSYTSSNTDAVYFENVDGVTYFHCGNPGTATVTVTCTYNGKTASKTITVTVAENVAVDANTVTDAINAAVGETVTVKGIVGPSLVNRDGFYLIDETGIVAITTSTANIALLEIGQEVVLTGMRDKFHNNEGDHAGQIAITSCEIVANYYGNYAYCDTHFITGKTVADIVALDITEDHSTSVYVVKATIEYIETPYYTSLKVTDNGTELNLYMSGAGQYSWLMQFAGQEVTIEVAPCNWNNKKDQYRGSILAVILEDGTKVVNTLNFDKY